MISRLPGLSRWFCDVPIFSRWEIHLGNRWREYVSIVWGFLKQIQVYWGDERMNHHVPAGVHQDTNRNVSTCKKNVESAGAKTRRDKSSLIEAHQKQSWTTNDYAKHIFSCYMSIHPVLGMCRMSGCQSQLLFVLFQMSLRHQGASERPHWERMASTGNHAKFGLSPCFPSRN